MNQKAWHEDRGELLAFLRWMVEDARVDAALMLEIIEHPEQWETEHSEYLREEGIARAGEELSPQERELLVGC